MLITLLSAGVCTITASQGGNAIYTAASVTHSFTVNVGKPSGTLAAAPGSPNATGTEPLSGPLSAVAGDFNGDGVEDIAVAISSNSVAVFLGSGSGAFGAPVLTPVTGGI